MRALTQVLFVALFLVACASTNGTRATRRSSRVITADEIATSSAKNAYEAIQLLRPQWLTRRSGVATPSTLAAIEPVAYVNGMKLGGLRTLQTVHVLDIREIRYLSPTDATTRFGTNHMGGAILITTR